MFLRSRADDTNTTILPSPPLVVTPSGDWDGNDGRWSSFIINVGDVDGTGRGQNFRVLISISSPVTQVPLQSAWCGDTECAEGRGVEIYNSKQVLGFEEESSKGWTEDGTYSQALPDWWSDRKLNGTWGWSNVGLGTSSPQSTILEKQVIVGNIFEELYMGEFGLAILPVQTAGKPQATFLENLHNAQQNPIPSRSYGYTAGAYYRNKGQLGNLVLGGYDASRFEGGVPIAMLGAQNTSLVVGVQSITYRAAQSVDTNTESFTADESAFLATIDSTLPYLWLPDDICDHFAEKFQLKYDEDSNMYTVNDTAHSRNTQQNATVTFKIADGTEGSNDAASISLPYAAFDLEGNKPLFSKATKYFPLKKSPNGMFVLGRAFLQEAYVVVDYERSNFTVAPAVFSDPMPASNIVSIYTTDYVPPSSSNDTPPASSGGGGLSGGAIAGIVVGILAVVGLLAFAAFFFWKRRRQQQHLDEKLPPPSEIDTMQAAEQVKHRRVSELDSNPPNSPKPSMGGYYDREGKDISPFPPINEMESPPAELYSPPPESIAGVSSGTPQSERTDYFNAGAKMRRRGATRESSGQNTPGTPAVQPIAELPGDDGRFTVDGQHFEPVESPVQSRAQSPVHNRGASDANIDEVISGQKPEAEGTQQLERRPSHARGASDTTIQSDSTAVSQPSPEELEEWRTPLDGPRRPLSE